MKFTPENSAPFAEGAEKKIYDHPHSEERVVAVFKEGPKSNETERSMKGRFYLTKILHILMPQNIPDVHLSAIDDEAVLISERKNLDDDHNEHNRLNYLYHNKQIKAEEDQMLDQTQSSRNDSIRKDPRFIEFYKKIRELGVFEDLSSINLGNDEQGNLVYVDNTFLPWSLRKNETPYGGPGFKKWYSPEKIRELAESLHEPEKEKVLSYLTRLETLFEEEKVNLV